MVRKGDYAPPQLTAINDRLHLLVGDLLLSSSEDQLSEQWNNANSTPKTPWARI